jgi:hypothetical protein
VLTRARASEAGRWEGAELGRGASAVPGLVVDVVLEVDEAGLDEAGLDARPDVVVVAETRLEDSARGGSPALRGLAGALARGASLGGRLERHATGAKSKRSTRSTTSSTGASSLGTRGGSGSVGPSPSTVGGALDGRLRTMSLGALRTT